MNRNRIVAVSATFLVLVVVFGVGSVVLDKRADVASAAEVQAPIFEVDPLWPKPLPNHWVLGWTVGVTVDPEDHTVASDPAVPRHRVRRIDRWPARTSAAPSCRRTRRWRPQDRRGPGENGHHRLRRFPCCIRRQ